MNQRESGPRAVIARTLVAAIAPLAMVLALTACTPVPSTDGAGVPAAAPTSTPTSTPSATPSVVAPPPTPAVDVPIVSGALAAPRASVPPVRVQVGAEDIDLPVVPVGVESGGAFMELPEDPAVAGWYRFGPDALSEDGNVVVAAHIDSPSYPIGPFSRLRDLSSGEIVVVTNTDGSQSQYVVASVTYYAKQDLPTESLFAREGTRELVLITCGGAFDSSTGHYEDNVVVVASPVA